MGDSPIDNMCLFHTCVQCCQAGLDLREHCVGDNTFIYHFLNLCFIQARNPTVRVVDVGSYPVRVAYDDKLFGANFGSDFAGGAVGVYIQLSPGLVFGYRGDDRYGLPLAISKLCVSRSEFPGSIFTGSPTARG